MPADDYDSLKAQYLAVAREPFSEEWAPRFNEARQRLREYCIANGRDLTEFDASSSEQIMDWAGYLGG